MARFTPCTCDQIHGPIYTQPVLVIKSMVPFTPWKCVYFGVKCMVPFTPLYFCLLWGQTHAPFTPVLLSVVGSIHGLIYTLYL